MNELSANATLHDRLLALDPTAVAELCEVHLAVLLDHLQRRYPRTCSDLVTQAVHDALIEYAKRPARYDPTLSSLPHYLLLAAERDLLNAFRGEARHQRRRIVFVELLAEEGNPDGRTRPVDDLIRREDEETCRQRLHEVRSICTPGEQLVLDLMLAGERSTSRFAEALGVLHLPSEQQECEVKRVKDRLKKRLLRGGRCHGAA